LCRACESSPRIAGPHSGFHSAAAVRAVVFDTGSGRRVVSGAGLHTPEELERLAACLPRAGDRLGDAAEVCRLSVGVVGEVYSH
jgi:hypothetical protein